VLDLFAYSLQQNRGYLFLGKAETARPTKANFELIDKKWKIYRCSGGPLSLPVHDTPFTPRDAWYEPRRRHPMAITSSPQDVMPAEVEISQLRRINETILRHTPVALVTIDRAYKIVTINAAARRLLGVRDISYDQDFLHTVRALPYQDARDAIDTAFRERTNMNLAELELAQTADASTRFINLTIAVMQVEQAYELAVITVMDVTEQVQTKRRLEAVQREQTELVAELSAVNQRYSVMNKELQDANEELQAANEELMLTQEELQATNEEFEATNEELQAMNEELETNNEELQATNEELQTTNDELTARTMELQEMTLQHQNARLQMSQLLERFPHYVLVLNAEDLTIQAINPGYQELLKEKQVIGLPISEIFSGKDVDQLVKELKTAIRKAQTINTPPILASAAPADKAADVRFIHTIVPISDANGSGVNRLLLYSEKMT
jgi:two-component system, chemotaxis family, CheB/CheR fusion protein